jgi:hypothetical protein
MIWKLQRAVGEWSLMLWQQLYALIWLAFFEIVIVVLLPGSNPFVLGFHVVLGLAILGLAYSNNTLMKRTEAPARLKRIVNSTATLATAQLVLGVILVAVIIFSLGNTVQLFFNFLHLTVALAIIAQASSVATAYDMWAEHEFAPVAQPQSANIIGADQSSC